MVLSYLSYPAVPSVHSMFCETRTMECKFTFHFSEKKSVLNVLLLSLHVGYLTASVSLLLNWSTVK